jgi:hypothetical protein
MQSELFKGEDMMDVNEEEDGVSAMRPEGENVSICLVVDGGKSQVSE